jgi:hypothetical protein
MRGGRTVYFLKRGPGDKGVGRKSAPPANPLKNAPDGEGLIGAILRIWDTRPNPGAFTCHGCGKLTKSRALLIFCDGTKQRRPYCVGCATPKAKRAAA